MAVYTRLEPPEVAGFVAAFGGGAMSAFEAIPQGIENTNYRVDAAGGRFVLTVFERETAAEVRETLELASALADRGAPCPRPCRGPHGVLGALGGKPAALIPFVEGEIVWAPGAAHLESLGRALGRFHRAGEGVAFRRDGPHRARVLAPLARSIGARLADTDPGLAALLVEEAAWQEGVPEAELPAGVVHADLFRDNVLFEPGGTAVRAFLDLQLAGTGPWLYDLAVVLLDAGWGARGVVEERARAVLAGYRAERPLAEQEVALLPAYLRRAALRFWCLRLQRFRLDPWPMAAGAVKDPGEVEARLRVLRGEAP